MVGSYLVEFNPPHPNPDMQVIADISNQTVLFLLTLIFPPLQANQQQQIADVLSILPKLGR